jgi:undecaprenyl-diphosphatase
MDFSLYKLLNDFVGDHRALADLARFVAEDAQFFFVALLAILFMARGKWRSANGRHGVVAAGFSALLGLAAAHAIATVWERPRPYLAHPADAHLLVARSQDSSFPSDHATAAFAIAVAIWLRHRRAGWLALGMAAVLSVSRVAVGTHYPTDILGGALIGTLAALLLWLPPLRERLRLLAEWAGGLYDRVAAALLARLPGAQST